VIATLRRTPLLCRGPKPVAVLKREGLVATVVAPEPNTWRELLGAIDTWGAISGRRVFVQEYGERNEALLEALRERGASVQAVPIYAWSLPDDLAPLEAAIRALCGATVDAVLFTSGQQARNLFEVATRLGLADELSRALATRVLVASIGPVTSETLQRAGVAVDLAPEHPKMGPMVLAVLRQGPELLATKRAQHA
jgi:uroporphyrinogen-III synthase